MKTPTPALSAALALLAASATAGTYTWTGAGNTGLWSTPENWNYDGAAAATSPGMSPADDVVISGEGVVVVYDTSVFGFGDFTPQTGATITVADGARLEQNGGNWANFQAGATLVLDGGSYDAGSQTQFRLNDGNIVIRNGGSFTCSNGELTRGNDSCLTVESGTMVLAGNYSILPADTLGKGSIVSTGELSLRTSVTLDGFSLGCSTLVPQNNPPITLKEGTLSTRRTADASDAGVWGTCTIDFIVGKSASFSALVWNDKTPYADTFGTSRFKYNGDSLSQEQFDEIFTTETAADGGYVRYTVSTEEVAGAPAIASHSAVYSESAIAFSVALESSSAADTVLTLYYDTADHEHNTSFGWPNAAALVEDPSDGLFKATVSVPEDALYYYLISASSASADQTIWIAGTVVAADMPEDSFVWIGNTPDASLPSNWSRNALPGEDDIVEFNAFYSRGGVVEWDSEAIPEVAGWRQSKDVYVKFDTTESRPFAISGDASLTAGSWTHVGPSDEPDGMVNVSVGGDMTIGAAARIVAGTGMNANDDDGAPRGYTRGNGPGYLRTAGGSHAGEGGHVTNTTGFVSYGSVLDPLSWGSGGWGDGNAYAGGGVIKLAVSGTLSLDGAIRSRGFGYPLGGDYVGGAGSGGSVNLTAGRLSGSGSIDANGGSSGLYGPGSGGRVKVALTAEGADFDGFSGTIEAVGGSMQDENQCAIYDLSPAAAGTVCLQKAGSVPVVKVFNEFRFAGIGQEGTAAAWRVASGEAVPSATHLPAMQDGDSVVSLLGTGWELSGHGALRLTDDVRVLSLSLESDDGSQCVYTEGRILTVKSLSVAGTALGSGEYRAADLPGIVVGSGSVVVDVMPTLLIVR